MLAECWPTVFFLFFSDSRLNLKSVMIISRLNSDHKYVEFVFNNSHVIADKLNVLAFAHFRPSNVHSGGKH